MHARTSLAFAALCLTVGCAPIAITPAIRTVPLETAATVRTDHVGVRLGGGGHAAAWAGDTATASGGIGVGMYEDVELQLDGSMAWNDALEARSVSPFAATGRIGVKHRVLDWLAFTGGIGAGSGPWGAFMGGDLGAIFAYENPYVVPFVALRAQLAGTLDPVTERFVEQQSDGSETVTLLTPGESLWLQPSTGIRIPICVDADCEGVRISITLAFATTVYVGLEDGRTQAALGGEGGLVIEP